MDEDQFYRDWLRAARQNPPGLPPDADPYTMPGMFPANTVSQPVDMRNIRAMQGAPPVPRTMSPEDFNSVNPFDRRVLTYGLNEQALKGYLSDGNPMPPIPSPAGGAAPKIDPAPLRFAPPSGRSFRERIQHLPPSTNVEIEQPPQEAPSIGGILASLMGHRR